MKAGNPLGGSDNTASHNDKNRVRPKRVESREPAKGVLTIWYHIMTKVEFGLNARKAGNPLGGSGNIARG